ncbi:MAG: AMP-binding protein [Acidobacteria bacterium]|nr:AMP-binding protein [Acidobacteriota bacterium]
MDGVLMPLFEKLRERVSVSHVVVITDGEKVPEGMLDYEALLESASGQRFAEPAFDENQAAAMCYTTGTTGRPKGVLYSLGHKDVSTTMVYTHVLNRGGRGVLGSSTRPLQARSRVNRTRTSSA